MLGNGRGYRSVDAASQEEIDTTIPFTDEDEKQVLEPLVQQSSRNFSNGRILFWVSLGINATLSVMVVWQFLRTKSLRLPIPPYPDLVYSPAQHLIEYEQVDFVDGLRFLDGKPRSVYLGPPTEECDAARDHLYDIGGISQIPVSEAANLSEPTAKVLDEPGYNFVGLDVFHQLDCLNWVRKMLRPKRYGLGMDDFTEEQRNERLVHTGRSPFSFGIPPMQVGLC